MGGHPFRETPPESGGAHCVECGRQLPRAQLSLGADGSVVCDDCRAPAHEPAPRENPAERATNKVLLVLVSVGMVGWLLARLFG